MSGVRCLEVRLTIPDNEASTALATLQRLGVPVAGLSRADVYRCEDVEPAEFEAALAAFRTIETLFNPNKHTLRVRSTAVPQPGEVWIDERSEKPPEALGDAANAMRATNGVRVAGRVLPGVRSLARFTAWGLHDESGGPAPAATVAAATETLLCNPAFQRATTA